MCTKQRLLALLIGAALACSAGAQAPDDGPNGNAPAASAAAAPGQVDPPARVARLANFSGNVSFTPAGENDWVQAQLNRPVATGDKLWTADGARAELQVGSSTVRLDYRSNFDFLNLNDRIAQMELTQGTLSLDVWRLRGDETYEVDTPTIAFIANRVGDYRVDVDPQGRFTTVTARRGGGEAVGEGGKRVVIEEGQSVRFNDSQLNDYQVNVRTPDDFDLYCTQRRERHARAQARNYVSEDVVGYEDLDDYGSWESVPEYGHVWYPNSVAVDWAPYHYGHWVWVDPWGWTWVDDAPWGFAPFHYGRWAYVGSRWGWVPGPVDVAPVYAPALVAFVGGGGFGLSVSVGGPIGWFALGPGDVYFPGYHCGRDYFARVNLGDTYVNRTVVNNYYGSWSGGSVNYSQMAFANRNAPRALAAMQTAAFAAGRPVASSAVVVNRTTMANARVLPRALVAPTRASLVAGSDPARTMPPASAIDRGVVAAHTPPAAQPSFAQRQSLLQKSAGQPFSMNQMRTLATQTGARGAAASAANVRVVGRATGAPAHSIASQPGTGTTTPPNNGRGPQPATTSDRNFGRTAAATNAASRLRSAEFAHPNGSRLDNNPQFSGKRNDAAHGGTPAATPGTNHVRSSTFAHAPSGRQKPDRGAEIGQPHSATAATAAAARGGRARGEPLPRSESPRDSGASTAMRGRGNSDRVAAPQSSAPTLTQRFEPATRSRGNDYAPRQAARPATSREYARTPWSSSGYRAGQPASTQVRAAPTRPAFTQRVQEQRAPVPFQHGPPQRAQAPQRAFVQQAPPQQRGPAAQRQKSMARAAPQHAAPRGNEKNKDGGG